MLYTIIDLYEVMRSDDVYSDDMKYVDNTVSVCTNPYDYLNKSEYGGLTWKF